MNPEKDLLKIDVDDVFGRKLKYLGLFNKHDTSNYHIIHQPTANFKTSSLLVQILLATNSIFQEKIILKYSRKYNLALRHILLLPKHQ